MKRALVSVSDKTNLIEFVSGLKELGYEIISTGGTKKALDNAGLDTIGISEVTGFPEIMDGRVKTLHPKVHGALLCVRDNPEHVRQIQELGIDYIDLVCVVCCVVHLRTIAIFRSLWIQMIMMQC